MPESATPPAATPPPTPPAAPAAAVAPAAPKAAPKPAPVDMTSAVLKQRLDESRNAGASATLKALGFASQEEADAYLTTKREQDAAAMTDAEKTAARIKELEATEARTAQLEQTLAAHAQVALASLTDKQRDEITKAADKPEEQLRLIGLMQSVGAIEPPAVSAASVPPATAPPATTTPPATAPADPPTSPPDHHKIWQDLKSKNPVQAAHYLARHSKEVFPDATA